MRLVLIADAFPPMRSSGAVQLRDLAREFVRRGHDVTVLVPAPGQTAAAVIDRQWDLDIVRLKALPTRDISYVRRTIGELLMPFLMLRNLRRSSVSRREYDAVIWYSPTIFLGPLVSALKRQHRCPSYLIVRDIFPQWALDMGLIRKGIPYLFFKRVAEFQYSLADVIGVQTPGNLAFFDRWVRQKKVRMEVLQNWLTPGRKGSCPIDVPATSLAGRKIFVYAGNMGVAQGMDKLMRMAADLADDPSAGFIFVGRGSDRGRLQLEARALGLENILFFDEIDPDEMTGLFTQCDFGLVALDSRHKTHNIPGKFISYMHAGLPVLASINPGNDLEAMIANEGVGKVSIDPSGKDLEQLARSMLYDPLPRDQASGRCRELAQRLFSAQSAAAQIEKAVSQ